MSLSRFFDKRSEAKTPLLMKVVVVIQIWFLLSGLTTTLTKGIESEAVVSLLAIVAQVVALIAIWNLRKWGVLVFAAITILGFLMASTFVEISVKVIVAVILFRGLVIIPALIYWKRMT